MTVLKKIDSNVTGLRYAEEASLGVLPDNPTWVPLEPNSYSNFGGQVTTVARMPINASRQRRKGTVTDLSVGGSVNQDYTQSALQDVLQGYFFADVRRKFEAEPATVVTSGHKFDVASTSGVALGALLFASGFSNAINNGLTRVTSIIANTSIGVSTAAVDETAPAGASLVCVGQQFGATELSVDVSGELPVLVGTAAAAANTLTIALDTSLNGQTVTLGGKVYTFRSAAVTTVANDVHYTSAADAITNLVAAVNGAAGAGSLYGSLTVASPDVSGVDSGGGVGVFTARVAGTDGNAVVASETLTDAGNVFSDTGGFLIGGTGTGFTTLGLVPGEFIYVGGDGDAFNFTEAVNQGFARVHAITDDTHMSFDKTQETFVADAGTGKTVQLFFGRVLKNESDSNLIKRRTYNVERTLGAPDDAEPSQVQAEYLVGSVPSTFKWNFKTGAMITVDFDFVGTDNQQHTSVDGLKAGTRPDLTTADAYNTSSDFARLKLAILDPTTSNPSALFGFVSDLGVTIDNKLTPNKAISVLGAFEVSAGFFNVDLTATAYFSEVQAVQAVRNNSDVTIDYALVKNTTVGSETVAQGTVMDVPLVALGDGRLNVAINAPIDLALTIPAAGDRVFDHTLLMVFFDYLPQASVPTS